MMIWVNDKTDDKGNDNVDKKQQQQQHHRLWKIRNENHLDTGQRSRPPCNHLAEREKGKNV